MSSDLTDMLLGWLGRVWPWLTGFGALVLALIASSHVILNKRDARAAIGWTGLIWFNPFIGAPAYYLLGINRIRRRASRLAAARSRAALRGTRLADHALLPDQSPRHLRLLSRTVGRATGVPLTYGNRVRPLVDGDEAFPEMLRAIREAERSIAMASYIFDHDRAGRAFVSALAEAAARDVAIRVLIDGVGARYSRPRITELLERQGIPVAEFLPSRLPWKNPYYNLRNHRKLLIVDGKVAFTGGMNVREGCLLELAPPSPIQDIHFRFTGPVVTQLFLAFAEDWQFTTHERLGGPVWSSPAEATWSGGFPARAIPDGPDENFETLRWTLHAAVGAAQQHVRIMTPYFLPDTALTAAVRVAAIRGVEVEILIPEVSNLRFVHWACMAQLWQYLEVGCRVWLVPPPFDHSKLFVVDGAWSLVGSANWDARSLRLNFELGVECYGETLAAELMRYSDAKRERSRQLTLAEVDARSTAIQLRDGVARLFSPYL